MALPQQQTAETGIADKSVDDLTRMIARPSSMQEKFNAMEALAMRNDVTPGAIQELRNNLTPDTGALTGPERLNAVDSKRAAALSLGLIDGRLGQGIPTKQLPGFAEMRDAYFRRDESPEVKKAILQGLRLLNRQNDPELHKIFRDAAKSHDAQTAQLGQAGLNGQPIDAVSAAA